MIELRQHAAPQSLAPPARHLRNSGFMWAPVRVRTVAAALLGVLSAFPQTIAGDGKATVSSVPSSESLNYSVEWRLIRAGNAKLTWNKSGNGGAPRSEIKVSLESAGLVSRL